MCVGTKEGCVGTQERCVGTQEGYVGPQEGCVRTQEGCVVPHEGCVRTESLSPGRGGERNDVREGGTVGSGGVTERVKWKEARSQVPEGRDNRRESYSDEVRGET